MEVLAGLGEGEEGEEEEEEEVGFFLFISDDSLPKTTKLLVDENLRAKINIFLRV